jgi:cyclopropane fatty-acyl-phospholipid synthase-like methyltransferase
MRSLIYRLSYWLKMIPWDIGTTPPEVMDVLEAMPAGRALDLGCGTGTNVITMAKQGWEAIGLDYVPQAIALARRKAAQAGVADRVRLEVADVSRLAEMDLPHCQFALDMGCFHGLSPEDQRRYVEGLARLMQTGGQFLLYALAPRQEAGIAFGLQSEQVREVVAPFFKVTKEAPSDFWRGRATWYWMERAVTPPA